MTKLTEDTITRESWREYAASWEAVIDLRSEMDCQRGQAIIECICLDESVLHGLGAARQLSGAIMDEPPKRLMKLLKDGPGAHLRSHDYEYTLKLNAELALIRRLKELQNRAAGLFGALLLSLMVGASNFLSRLLYDDTYGQQ